MIGRYWPFSIDFQSTCTDHYVHKSSRSNRADLLIHRQVI